MTDLTAVCTGLVLYLQHAQVQYFTCSMHRSYTLPAVCTGPVLYLQHAQVLYLPAVCTLPAACTGPVLYLQYVFYMQYAQVLYFTCSMHGSCADLTHVDLQSTWLAASVDLFTGPVPYVSHLELHSTWLLVSICSQVNAELEIPPTRVLQLELNPGH